ncbi:polysulfide reductase chain C [Caldalkalibacillus uzonensis]|uniref:Polysulfide reductase chain C n=1 Tax=Caldalkalibacillus uzonensis TaxID=353224 RepID=A0ABU0CT83_9BACI|nr:NrfD/PsrC family molybdoenzyme membrane anchor subunit [Caldalkalibacillus uzonensis]MDQ0339624.1 polysulfide reductase chain C [Caldalkalibacillus uzonensis]
MPYIYELTQLKSPHFPWQVIAYLFVNGIAAGAFLIAALLQAYGGKFIKDGLHKAYYITCLLMPFCGLFLIGKLQIKTRFTNVLWNSRDGVLMLNTNSPMSVGAWVLTTFSLFAVIAFIYAVNKDGLIRWGWFQRLGSLARYLHERGPVSKIYLTVGAALAAWFASYLGILVTTTHVPSWNATPFIPMLWIVSAVAVGTSVIILTLLFFKRREYESLIEGLNRVVISVLVINLAAIALFVFGLGEWSHTVNSGHYGWLLWAGTVVLGHLLPLILKLKPGLIGARTNLILSSFLIILGGLLLRYVVIMGPQSFW